MSLSGVGDFIQDNVLNVFLFRDCCFSSFFCLFSFISAVSNSLAATDCFPRKNTHQKLSFFCWSLTSTGTALWSVGEGRVWGYRVHIGYILYITRPKRSFQQRQERPSATTRTGVKVVQGTSPVQSPPEQVLRWYRVPRQCNHHQNRC